MQVSVNEFMTDLGNFVAGDTARRAYLGEFNDESLRKRVFNLVKLAAKAYLDNKQAEYLGVTILCNETNNDEYGEYVNVDVHYALTRERVEGFRMQINTSTGEVKVTGH